MNFVDIRKHIVQSEKILTNLTRSSLTHSIDLVGEDADALAMVVEDPAGGQSLRFANKAGRQVVTYVYRAEGTLREIMLNDSETAELTAWRNNGRRTSYWDWPGWEAVKARAHPVS